MPPVQVPDWHSVPTRQGCPFAISLQTLVVHALPCELAMQLRSKEQQRPANLREIRPGGVVLDVDGSWVPGTHVEMQVRQSDSDEHGLKVRGIIARADRGSLVISLAEQPSEAHERRLRRFVIEIIRHRVHN